MSHDPETQHSASLSIEYIFYVIPFVLKQGILASYWFHLILCVKPYLKSLNMKDAITSLAQLGYSFVSCFHVYLIQQNCNCIIAFLDLLLCFSSCTLHCLKPCSQCILILKFIFGIMYIFAHSLQIKFARQSMTQKKGSHVLRDCDTLKICFFKYLQG